MTTKCFAKSGITISGSSSSVVSWWYEDEDPFDHIEAQEELHDLYDQLPLSDTACPVEEYINGDDYVPICMQYDNNWESLLSLAPQLTHLIKKIRRILAMENNLTLNHLYQK